MRSSWKQVAFLIASSSCFCRLADCDLSVVQVRSRSSMFFSTSGLSGAPIRLSSSAPVSWTCSISPSVCFTSSIITCQCHAASITLHHSFNLVIGSFNSSQISQLQHDVKYPSLISSKTPHPIQINNLGWQ